MAKKEISPMMKQYYNLKSKHPEAVLLFRCGDFYESYEDDAKTCADILGITLTKSSKTGVSMAGFPYHALDTYLPKLIRAKCRVAICDQLEDPKLTKKLVKRGITEMVIPNDQTTNHLNDQTMKLNIKNNNETMNVANVPAVNNQANAAAAPVIEEAVIVSEEPKAKPKSKQKAKAAPSEPQFYIVTYVTKAGETGSYVMGFKEEAAVKALADAACNTVKHTWRRNDKGEKVYGLSFAPRYIDVAKALCDALNRDDKAAIAKAIAQTHDVYAVAVADNKAKGEAKRKAKKEEEAKAKAKELAKVKKENGLMSREEVAELLKRAMAGEDVPELQEIKEMLKVA